MDKEFTTVWAGEEVKVKIPEANLLNVIEPHEKPQLSNPEEKLRKLLENPIGGKKLVDIVKPRNKVALLSSEFGRLPFTWILAPVVVDVLKKSCGIRDEDIIIVNAPGTHQTEEQQQQNPLIPKLWGPLYGKHKLVLHDCDKKDQLTYMGETSLGTPVWINKPVAECDVKIGFGELKPHHAAAHCGGGKIINPGICGRASVTSMHKRVMCKGFREFSLGGPDPRNHVRRDQNESAQVAGLDFKVDAITNPVSRNLIDVVAGDVVKEWEAGVKLAQETWATKVKKKADIAMYLPREGDAYISGAYMYTPITSDMATKEDGIIIPVVPAQNGYSRPGAHQAFPPKIMRLSSDDMGFKLAEGSYDGRDMSLMWQTKKIYEEKTTILATRYPKEAAKAIGFGNIARSAQGALDEAFKIKGKNAMVSVVYKHNHMYPFYT
jgi:nickel-dependent lactate racemase